MFSVQCSVFCSESGRRGAREELERVEDPVGVERALQIGHEAHVERRALPAEELVLVQAEAVLRVHRAAHVAHVPVQPPVDRLLQRTCYITLHYTTVYYITLHYTK